MDDKGESALLLFIAVLCNDCKHINVELGRLLECEWQYVLEENCSDMNFKGS